MTAARRSLRSVAVLALGLASSAGCSEIVQVDEYTFDVDPCGPRRPTACVGGRELAFVISSSDIPPMGPGGRRDGFDLDGTDAAICGQPDFTSIDGQPAIDNQMAPIFESYQTLAGVSVREDYERATVEGTSITLLVLSHVDDLANDDCIEVTRREGLVPEGVDVASFDEDGDGVIDAGLTLDYSASLDNDTGACAIDGVVHARFASRLQAIAGGVEATTDRGRLSMPVTEAGTTAGLLGGSIRVEELRGLPEAVVDFLRPRADLDPSSRTARDCASLSFAQTFHMVPVTLGLRRAP